MTPPTIKFLLVDDLDANLLALEGLLRRDGLELLKARSGPEALELLLVHDVALALLDVQMAGMDGFELAELMRGTERTRRVPIIFLTAGAVDQQRRFRGYEAGAVDFIFKPIEAHILQSKAGIFFELAKQREALRQNAEEAHAASRAKDDFLAALSHELRTPLTPVLMSAASLQDDQRLPADVREQLAMMRRNIELEARLIDDLLDVTRISRGKLTIAPIPADIHELLRHSDDIIRSDGQDKNVQVDFELTAVRHHALADPTRLHQVFWNLLKNALKFSPAGGTVTVRTRNDAEDRLVLTVEDHGVGISPEALPHIFRAFEQGDVVGQHRFGGLGLGLAISQAIVEAHSGEIHADSPGVGQGATFMVALATVEAPAVAADTPAEPASLAPALRLLIVEDHEATRTMLARLLSKSGHRVTLASSIAEGLAAVALDHFDAVISDLGLPDGSGLDLMREIRRQRPVHGIALSGYGMEEDVRQTREAGFFAHLVKPVSIDQLRQLLAHIPQAVK
ncbi:phospho-acceptor domain-containing protein [Prosthecobacter fusiformis]|uniref:histidine kinase n=1 Tax=Prosthecobacter fusiformis TaxID=48464 RepID=A0A4R7S0W1_9BACT|nr:response regulator [Prosthecobacter fusiformis]TDU71309.1 phospho-acceptor domain-containing protein [Prosthecobacter fusiformis]